MKSLNVGFVATRLAGVDGVSLEVEKLVHVLKGMGHQSFYCAGELESDSPPSKLVPAMHFTDPVAQELHDTAFATSTPPPGLFEAIYDQADRLREEIRAFIEEFKIDLLISQNASTIPMNLSLGVALRDIVERTRLPMICHNHDFYWERERFLHNGIGDILDTAFPPRLEPVKHYVINSIMQHQLYLRRGISSTYLPNVFNFENPPPPSDSYARNFRSEMGIDEDDIIFLQPTRIIRRKAIEKAIELVRKLDDERIVLIVTGYEGDEKGDYGNWLREEARRAGIRCRFIGDRVAGVRGEYQGKKLYSLWDIYPHADIVTYPSTYEGFGNAFVEALYFHKPVVVHTYSVYLSNIKPVGIRAIEFNYDITDTVLNQVRHVLSDVTVREEMVNHNYEIGMQNFSFRTLDRILSATLQEIFD